MKKAHLLVVLALIVAGFAATGGGMYYWVYYRHKDTLESELVQYTNAIAGYETALDKNASLDARLQELSNTTLGFDRESVDSRFRDGLRALAKDAGLAEDDIIVTTSAARPVRNPAVEANVSEFRRARRKEYVDMPDLMAMDAELRGAGSFKAVTRLLSLAQAQPWIWSVRGFTLKPQDRSAQVFDIAISVTTVFMPDLAPANPDAADVSRTGTPPIKYPSAEHVRATATIAERNIFAPPPVIPDTPKTEIVQADPVDPGADPSQKPPAPPPPPPPYHEWRLTGVSGSPAQGVLAWMLNTRTGSARLLKPGETVLDARLVNATADEVVFQIQDTRFRLALNQTLADRQPVD